MRGINLEPKEIDNNKYGDLTQCVVDAQNGVDGAFDALYTASYPYAFNAASNLLKNKEDVEDALQNSFYCVSKSIADLKIPEAYLRWLNRIVINECKKIMIEQSRHAKAFYAEKSRLLAAEKAKSHEDEQFESTDLVETISKIIDEMKPKKSEILKLYYFENLSYSEISEKLGIPAGTVMSRLHHAKKDLEHKVKELRKNGTVLWSFPVLPLIAAVLSYNVKADIPVASAAQISAGAVSASSAAVSASGAAGTSTAAVSATASAGSAGIGAAASAGTSIAVKAAAVAVAASVAVGGGAAAKAVIKNKTEQAQLLTRYVEEKQTNAFKRINPQTVDFALEAQSHNNAADYAEPVDLNKKEQNTEPVTTVKASPVIKQSGKGKKQNDAQTSRQEKTTAPETTTSTTTQTETSAATTTERQTEKTTGKTTPPETKTTSPAYYTTAGSTTAQNTTTTAKAETTTADPYDGLSVSNGVIGKYSGSGGAVTVPSSLNGQSVTAIGASAFAGSDVTSVSISQGVTKIGQMSFSDCDKLTSVSIPSTVTDIGDCAFDGCSALKSVTIPQTVTNIGDSAFDGCNGITVKCVEGSAAHEYAIENDIDFELI